MTSLLDIWAEAMQWHEIHVNVGHVAHSAVPVHATIWVVVRDGVHVGPLNLVQRVIQIQI